MDFTAALPADCISRVISLISPRDACRLSVVCPALQSVSDSDAAWESFLPSDYQEIISRSASPWLLDIGLSKKDLYLHLCQAPIIINNGTMSFALEKESGKKCYMVGARGLSITWGDTPEYWNWAARPESRFTDVAELNLVWWLDVKARIETGILSPRTIYAAYLVFNLAEDKHGFERRPVALGVYVEERDDGLRRSVLLDPPANMPQQAQAREDGWMEIEMGEFFNENGDDGTLLCTLFDFDEFCFKGGLVIEGIELRPINER